MRELLDRSNLRSFAVILLVFAIGLVGFYMFSADYGDGLEVTMEEAGIEESEPLYTSPLDYGDNYTQTLAIGITGFCITLLAGYTGLRIMRKKDAVKRD